MASFREINKAERHPLLLRAGIDDWGLDSDLKEVGMTSAPDLTFQYSPLGDLDCSAYQTETPLCEDAPAVYRERFVRRWTFDREDGKGRVDGEACWVRLRTLYAGVYADLPDNEHVQRGAWLLGLRDEMDAWSRVALDRLHARVERFLADKARDSGVAAIARETGVEQVLRSYVTDRCCNGNADECSFDIATEYVLPDGTRRTSFRCCH